MATRHKRSFSTNSATSWPLAYTPEFPGLVDYPAPQFHLDLYKTDNTGEIRAALEEDPEEERPTPVPGAAEKIMNYSLHNFNFRYYETWFIDNQPDTLNKIYEHHTKAQNFRRHEFPHAGSYPSAAKSVMGTEKPAKSVEQLEQRVRELQDEKRLLMEEDAQLKARIRQINASNESLRQGIQTLSMRNAKIALDVELARQGM